MPVNKKTDAILLIGADDFQKTSLSIGYLHAYLEAQAFPVKSIYLEKQVDADASLHNTIKTLHPLIVAIQVLSETRTTAFKTIEKIHTAYPHIHIVIGGPHATSMYKQILNKYPFILAILGEGEETLSELAKALADKKDISEIPGLAFMKETLLVKTPQRKLIESLDLLPFPKHELFIRDGKRDTSILTSRGCPFNCSFCCIYETKVLRFRSIQNIIDELIYIRDHFPHIDIINIIDGTFLIDNERVIEFCNAVLAHRLPFKYDCSGRFAPVSEPMVRKMEEAGFFRITFGLESANDDIRHKARKLITKEDVLLTVSLFSKTKIAILINLIIGLPGETWKTVKETARFIQKLQRIKYIFYITNRANRAIIYPGNELYEKMKYAGLVSDDIWLSETRLFYYTLEHSASILYQMVSDLHTYISLDYFFTVKGFLRQCPTIVLSADRMLIIKYLLRRKLPRVFAILKKTRHLLFK